MRSRNSLRIPVDIVVTFVDDGATGAPGGVGGDFANDPIVASFAALDVADKQIMVPLTDDIFVEGGEGFEAHLGTMTPIGTRLLDLLDQGFGIIVDDEVRSGCGVDTP